MNNQKLVVFQWICRLDVNEKCPVAGETRRWFRTVCRFSGLCCFFFLRFVFLWGSDWTQSVDQKGRQKRGNGPPGTGPALNRPFGNRRVIRAARLVGEIELFPASSPLAVVSLIESRASDPKYKIRAVTRYLTCLLLDSFIFIKWTWMNAKVGTC